MVLLRSAKRDIQAGGLILFGEKFEFAVIDCASLVREIVGEKSRSSIDPDPKIFAATYTERFGMDTPLDRRLFLL